MQSSHRIYRCNECGFSATFPQYPRHIILEAQRCLKCGGLLVASEEEASTRTPDLAHRAKLENDDDIGRINFVSSDHVRFEHGQEVSGHNRGANRALEIKHEDDRYLVTVFNLDGEHPLWGDNVQLGTKPMRVVRKDPQKIELRGFGVDSLGSSFVPFGITLRVANEEVASIDLHLHDRGVMIRYFK